jgi:hypothetical protein
MILRVHGNFDRVYFKGCNMAIKHYVGLPLQITGAVAGLFIFVIAESYYRGITPTELDGEYVVLVSYVGSISVIVASLVYYFVLLGILKSKRISDNISYFDVLTSGFLLGFIFLPSLHALHLLVLFKRLFPSGANINPLLYIAIGLMLRGILSIAITMTIFLILISKKKMGDRNKK